MKIEVIDWYDAVADAGWSNTSEAPHKIRSVGKVVEDTKTHVVLASTVSLKDDKQHNCRITIPTGMIHKRKSVRI